MEAMLLAPAVEIEAPRSEAAVAGAAAPGSGPFSVLVLAPHELVRYGIRLMLGREEWAGAYFSAKDLDAALGLAERSRPDLALVDVKLEDVATERACLALRRAAPGMRRLLLTTTDFVPPRTVASMGADGFVSKGWSGREVATTLQRVALGFEQQVSRPPGGCGLSPRQREIMQLLADGATNDEIAALLHLSASTVKQHTSAAYRKLGVRNRAAAISRARDLGLL